MRVLLTGAGGFLGRHLAAGLLRRGHAVVAVDLAFPVSLPQGSEVVEASVTDAPAMSVAAAGCDAVIHAAAITGLWARDVDEFDRVNAGGAAIVLGAAADAGASRGVLVSSYTTLVSGRRGAPHRVLDETEELAPEALLGAYPRSKRRAELIAAKAGVPTAIVLPSAPIGPGDARPTPPGALLRDLVNGDIPAMIDCVFNLVDVRAVADGVIAALEKGEGGRRYLLSGMDVDTDALLALVERVTEVPMPKARVPYGVALAAARVEAGLARLTGRPPKAPLTGVRLAGPNLSFAPERARQELGFAPQPVARAVRDALRWMRGAGMIRREMPGLDKRR